mgnify:CR=1 FL=1
MDAPIYLKKYTKKITTLPDFKYQNWFNSLSWKGQLCVDKCFWFSIYFEGILCEDGSIINEDKSPLKVYAKRQGYNEKIVLFDEELHGYTPLLIEKMTYSQKSKIKKYTNSSDINKIYVDLEKQILKFFFGLIQILILMKSFILTRMIK